MIERKFEYFECGSLHKNIDHSISMFPKKLHYQERDWTCSLAVLRSITSSIIDIGLEDDLINNFNVRIGPNYSKDIKNYHILDKFDNLDVLYGCDNQGFDVSDLIDLLDKGYYVACQWMLNYDHWTVLLGFTKLGSYDEDMLVYYCPYYNETRLIILSEFSEMWRSGNSGVNNIIADFIAVKEK